jgi:tetratricopeptide (TPR) repeat protein
LQNQRDQAKKSFEQAIQIDSRFTLPYVHLAHLAADENNWPEVDRLTTLLLPLDPIDSPEAYFFHAAAKAKIGETSAAEASAVKAVDLDKPPKHPEYRYLAGQVMAALGKRKLAAQYYREYLYLAPFAPDADQVRALLQNLE